MKDLPPGYFFALRSAQPSAQLCTLSLCLPFLCKLRLFKQMQDKQRALARAQRCRPHVPRQHGGKGGRGALRASSNFLSLLGTFFPDPLSTRLPKTWKPQLFRRQFYSEILDATMTITVTMRTLDLIDEAYGFDFYILKTPKADMCSKLGMDLKRTMLLRLARRDPKLHPDDPARREAIYNKYQEFAIPEEEAEWVGLSLQEAIEKQRLLEKKVSSLLLSGLSSDLFQDPVPLFKVYAEELVNQLKEQELQKHPAADQAMGFSESSV
uniref:Large ribosomal subunit protein bL28m n=1 Tax=Athene cunicularia TaxID=194338 RepID=A0A663N1G8_ATHCN